MTTFIAQTSIDAVIPNERLHYVSPNYLVSVPTVSQSWPWESHGVSGGALSMFIVNAEARLTGFEAYLKALPSTLDEVLTRCSWRPAVPGPMDTATIVLADDHDMTDPLERGARLISAAYELNAAIVTGRLSQAFHRSLPMDMGQFLNVFGTHLDVIQGDATLKAPDTRHIAVLCDGRVYVVSFVDPSPPLWVIRNALVDVAADASAAARSDGALSLFGACSRDLRREMLLANGSAHLALEYLQKSFLTVCLDLQTLPGSVADAGTYAQIRNYTNRWYPSAAQLVVFGNGRACLCCSFAANIDGNVMTRAASELQSRAARTRDVAGGASVVETTTTHVFRPLTIDVSPDLLKRGAAELSRATATGATVFTLAAFPESWFTSIAGGTSAFIALALHASLRAATRSTFSVYQYLSQSIYRHMGVRTVLVTTPLMVRAADELLGRVDSEVCLNALDECYRRMGHARRHISLSLARQMFYVSLDRRSLAGVLVIRRLFQRLLSSLRLARPVDFTVVLSRPDLYDNIALVGRPGVMPPRGLVGIHYSLSSSGLTLVFSAADGFPTERVVASLPRLLVALKDVAAR